MRAEIATARNLGVTLRRFHGWEPRAWRKTLSDGRVETHTEREFDLWEQAIQQAYDAYMDDLHPACGHPYTEALFDIKKPDRPKWGAAFYECEACEAIEREQNVQHKKDKLRAGPKGEREVISRNRIWFAFKLPTRKS